MNRLLVYGYAIKSLGSQNKKLLMFSGRCLVWNENGLAETDSQLKCWRIETGWLRQCHRPAGEDGMEPGANLPELVEARFA
jgi:hypothetical protein